VSPRRKPAPARSRTERLEWTLGIVSGLIVLGVIVFLAIQGVTGSGKLPDLEVTKEGTAMAGGAPQLRFTLANRGDRAATQVGVSLTLRDGSGAAEVRRLTVDHVPARSEVTGAFVLPPDWQTLTRTLAVEGYLDP
jgi:uncharacterized protein (TIGR02588 family)